LTGWFLDRGLGGRSHLHLRRRMVLFGFLERQFQLLDLLIQRFGPAFVALPAQPSQDQRKTFYLYLPLLNQRVLFKHYALERFDVVGKLRGFIHRR